MSNAAENTARHQLLTHLARRELETSSDLDSAREGVSRCARDIELLTRDLKEIRALIQEIRAGGAL